MPLLKNETKSINSLPNEILEAIFKHCDGGSLRSLILTSPRYKMIILSSKKLTKKLHIIFSQKKYMNAKVLKLKPIIHEIHLRDDYITIPEQVLESVQVIRVQDALITGDYFHILLNHTPNLKILIFEKNSRISWIERRLGDQPKIIEVLHLNLPIDSVMEREIQCEKLIIDYKGHNLHQKESEFIQRQTGLKFLELRGMQLEKSFIFMQDRSELFKFQLEDLIYKPKLWTWDDSNYKTNFIIFMRKQRMLKKLTIGEPIPAVLLEIILEMQHLTLLHLNTNCLKPESFLYLDQAKSLTVETLILNDGFDVRLFWPLFKVLPKITTLLCYFKITFENLQYISSALPQLKKFRIEGFSSFEKKFVCEKFNNLKTFTIANFECKDLNIFKQLLVNVSDVECLGLGRHGFHELPIELIMEELPNLSRLEVGGKFFTYDAFNTLAKDIRNLKILKVSKDLAIDYSDWGCSSDETDAVKVKITLETMHEIFKATTLKVYVKPTSFFVSKIIHSELSLEQSKMWGSEDDYQNLNIDSDFSD